MYFFDLEDYYTSNIFGQLNSRYHGDWEDIASTARETRNAYLKAINQWYIGSTFGLTGKCKTRVEELYKLIFDLDNPDGSKNGSVTSGYTYNQQKFIAMMNGINTYPSYTAETGDPLTYLGNYYYAWSGKCFDDQIYLDYINSFNEFKYVINELLYLIDGDDVPRLEKYSSVSDSGTTSCSSCKTINLNTYLTTDLPTINNVDEFRKAITSELIDVKNRQTLRSYPILRLLYERYLGNCTDCEKTVNKFTYDKMGSFINLIGKHWVDLIEQFVPSTTIWGATDVYRNTIFDQQKFKYRNSNLELTHQPLSDNNLITCRTYKGESQIDYGPLRTIAYNYESYAYNVTKEPMPDILPASATTVDFQEAAQTEAIPRSNVESQTNLNIQVGTVTSNYGTLTQAQINNIQSQINTIQAQTNSSNIFQVNKSVLYGLTSGPVHSSPMFYGVIKVIGGESNTKSLYE